MRIIRLTAPIALSALALAACSPEIPDSGAKASGSSAPRSATSTAAGVLGVADPSAPTVAPATGDPLNAMAPGAAATGQPGQAGAGEDSAALSDEQSFAAVTARETIASDAARIDQNRAQYVVIEPTQLPPRPDGTGASIVAYALATNNAPGQALYRRGGIAKQARFERNCARYTAPDQAQEAFLDAGGPKRDRYSLDPDGDGFACGWDPRPFRAARGGAPEIVETYEVVETPGES